jgi:outer membrane translocation and assembly module TamA
MGLPDASFQIPGARYNVPSAPRTTTQGEKVAPSIGRTQRPGSHPQRRRSHFHSPSIHTASVVGLGGTFSTRAGGGAAPTTVRAEAACALYVGCGSEDPQATASKAVSETIRCMAERLKHAATACAALLGTANAGCSSIPEGRTAIDEVNVTGAKTVSADEIASKLATAASPEFLGLFRGVVYDYVVLDTTVLQRDLARVERYCRGRGFFDARARAGRVTKISENHVRVEIVVEEGPATHNRAVTVGGLDGLPAPIAEAVRSAAASALPNGDRFDETGYGKAQTTLKKALTDRGYAYATVTYDAQVDVGTHAVDYSFTLVPGPASTFGKIVITGLDPDGDGPKPQEIGEEPLRRAIKIREGEPYSTARLEAATQALLDLEVFSSVDIVPSLPNPPPASHIVPLTVRVATTKLREFGAGGGVEFDEVKLELHGLVSWEDHNFLGGLRDFSVSFKPGVVFFPVRTDDLVAPTNYLLEERLRLQLRQPGFIEARTTGFVRPEFNVYPLLIPIPKSTVTPAPPPDPVVGYLETKAAVGADRRFGRFFVTLAHNVQIEKPFAYTQTLDPDLHTLVISYPQLTTTFDLRDDPVHPHEGIFLQNDLTVAGGVFGGSARDFRIEPEVRTYLPFGRRVTFATRATLGFLFASNYGSTVQHELATPIANDADKAARESDIETMYFRGFFSGGPSSNRGFPLRGLAPHGQVPFLNPSTANAQVANNCVPPTSSGSTTTSSTSEQYGSSQCLIPIGGFTLWELSNEFRFEVSGPFAAATFCDMGDVSPLEGNIRLDHVHLSCGFGLRYDTPVGPIRLDLGYRVPWAQVLGQPNEYAAFKADPLEGLQPRIFGQPIALAFGIGETF